MGTVITLQKQKVFIVEDNAMYREIIANEVSELANVEISTFSSAELCLREMDQNPSLVILDFYLDGENPTNMNGHTALQLLRTTKNDLPILFISSDVNEELLQEYADFRGVDFLLKADLGQKLVRDKIKRILN